MTNESKAIECMSSLDFTLCCYENGMFGNNLIQWTSTSPREIGAIDISMLDLEICKEELHEDTEISESSNHYVNSKL